MELSGLKNIGVKMSLKLNAIGVCTAEALCELGSKGAFFRLKQAYPEVCLVHLYALQGAIDNLDFNRLPQSKKEELKMYCDSLGKSSIFAP